jgi:hypothetical protein
MGVARAFFLAASAEKHKDRSADRLNTLGPVATPGGFVAAVENTAPSPGRTTGTGGARAAGERQAAKACTLIQGAFRQSAPHSFDTAFGEITPGRPHQAKFAPIDKPGLVAGVILGTTQE